MMVIWEDLKNGSKVIDVWYREVGVGIVKKKLKTVIHIRFPNSIRPITVYDKAHATKFLETVP